MSDPVHTYPTNVASAPALHQALVLHDYVNSESSEFAIWLGLEWGGIPNAPQIGRLQKESRNELPCYLWGSIFVFVIWMRWRWKLAPCRPGWATALFAAAVSFVFGFSSRELIAMWVNNWANLNPNLLHQGRSASRRPVHGISHASLWKNTQLTSKTCFLNVLWVEDEVMKHWTKCLLQRLQKAHTLQLAGVRRLEALFCIVPMDFCSSLCWGQQAAWWRTNTLPLSPIKARPFLSQTLSLPLTFSKTYKWNVSAGLYKYRGGDVLPPCNKVKLWGLFY